MCQCLWLTLEWAVDRKGAVLLQQGLKDLLAFIFCRVLTLIRYIEVDFTFGLPYYVRYIEVLFHTFDCNFGRDI